MFFLDQNLIGTKPEGFLVGICVLCVLISVIKFFLGTIV